jgi:hypothetical protein
VPPNSLVVQEEAQLKVVDKGGRKKPGAEL